MEAEKDHAATFQDEELTDAESRVAEAVHGA